MQFCPACGRAVGPDLVYCSYCGAGLRNASYSSRQPYQTVGATYKRQGKKPWIAIGLALVLGLFGIWGIGHLYAGKIARGLGLLFVGLIIGGLFWFSVILTVILIGYVGIVLFGLFFVGGWLWQAFDAYNAAQEYNELHATEVRNNLY
jgi:hypothetical protein